jgi:hypothetical protein
MLKSRNVLIQSCLFLMTSLIAWLALPLAWAQDPAGAATGAQPPVAYTSVNELNGILTPLQQTAQSMQADLTKVRIEKWKTDNATKREMIAKIDSIQRNLQAALPGMIAQLNNSPEDLGASFNLYRNLVVLNEYFGSVVDYAGAFASKDEYQSLGNDLTGLETERRAFGERMQKLVASKEDELSRLRAQVKTLSAAPPPPPKKIIVDDTEPPKKPVKKKVTKPKPPATAPAAPTSDPSAK